MTARLVRMAFLPNDPVPQPRGVHDGDAYKTNCRGPKAPIQVGPVGIQMAVAHRVGMTASEFGTLTRVQYYAIRYGEDPPE